MLHGARPPLAVPEIQEPLSEPGRSAEVGLQDGVAAVGEELDHVVEAPLVARPRSAVREHDRRQGLRHPRRDGEVGRDLDAVPRRISHRGRSRHLRTRDVRASAVEELEASWLPIVQPGRPRLDIGDGRDEHATPIAGHRAKAQVAVGELAPRPLQVLREAGLAGVPADSVSRVPGRDQLVGIGREQRAPEIDFPFGVGLHLFDLTGGRIEQDESREVGRAPARLHVEPRAVDVKADRLALLLGPAFEYRREHAFVDPQDLPAAVRPLPVSQAEPAGEVGDPIGDVLLVGEQELPLAGPQVEPPHVVETRVAVVQANDRVPGIVLGKLVDPGLHVGAGREIESGRNARACGRGGGGVDRVDVEVLVAALILDEEDAARVPAPERLDDRTASVVRHRPRGVERLFDPLDPHVEYAVQRLDERQPATVGRELAARDPRVAEEHLAVDQRRGAGRGRAAFGHGSSPSRWGSGQAR